MFGRTTVAIGTGSKIDRTIDKSTDLVGIRIHTLSGSHPRTSGPRFAWFVPVPASAFQGAGWRKAKRRRRDYNPDYVARLIGRIIKKRGGTISTLGFNKQQVTDYLV